MIFERWRTHRRLQHVPELGPDTLEGDLARVTGIVRVAREVLIAPRSERDCVGWRIRFHLGGGGDLSGGGAGVAGKFEASELRPFVIDRDGVMIAIDGEACALSLPASQPILAATGDPWRAFCEERMLGARDMMRWIEEVIVEPDMRVTVAGILVRDPQPPTDELGYREEQPARLRLTGTFDRPLLIGRPAS